MLAVAAQHTSSVVLQGTSAWHDKHRRMDRVVHERRTSTLAHRGWAGQQKAWETYMAEAVSRATSTWQRIGNLHGRGCIVCPSCVCGCAASKACHTIGMGHVTPRRRRMDASPSRRRASSVAYQGTDPADKCSVPVSCADASHNEKGKCGRFGPRRR